MLNRILQKNSWKLRALIVSVLFILALGISVSARESRTTTDRGDSTSRGTEVSPVVPSPNPSPIKPVVNNGGITSSTNGDVDTGGNIGGNVTTGDESVEVHEVNIGPTNPPAQDIGEDEDNTGPSPAPEQGCTGRDCRTDRAR